MAPTDDAITELADALAALPGVSVRREEPMSAHLPLRVGGPAELWVEAADADGVLAALRVVRSHKVGWRVHWPLSDWIVRDEGIPGVVLRPGRGFEQARCEGDAVRLGAAAPFGALAGHPHLAPLAAWAGTPGSVLDAGEGAVMAGICAEVRWIKGRTVETLAVPAGERPPTPPATAVLVDVLLRAAHRGSGTARLFRGAPTPPGTVFADPAGGSAAAELERARLAGTRLRAWRMSTTSPGLVVNLGDGTCQDFLLLTRGLESRVSGERGVSLELRLPVVGGARRSR